MKNQERIDRYINNEMSSDEQAAFAIDLKKNSQLASELRFQQDLFNFFEDEIPELENKLDVLGNKHFTNNRQSKRINLWTLLFFAIPIICIGFWLLTRQDSTLMTSPTKTQISPSPSSEEMEIDIKSEIINSETKDVNEAIKKQNLPVELPDNDYYSKKKDSPPIAFYEVNPDLENLLHENVRNTSVTILDAPKNESVLLASSDLFTLKGSTNNAPPYQLAIYSNRKFDFENDYPVLQREIKGKKNDSGIFNFEFSAKAKLSPGLYYLLLQNEDSELISISKFIVK